jgi:hypothetical protein
MKKEGLGLSPVISVFRSVDSPGPVPGRVRWWVGMVVRFVCVSVCPCVSRLPPVSFYRYPVQLYRT